MTDTASHIPSRYEQIIIAASVPGLLTLPLAFVHNQRPLAPQMGPNLLICLACLLDVALGVVLACAGLRLMAGRDQQPALITACALAAVLGSITGLGGLAFLASVDSWSTSPAKALAWVAVFAISLLSAGTFYLYGAPRLLLRRRLDMRRLGRTRGTLWMIAAAVLGALLSAGVYDRLVEQSGAGSEGSGLIALLAWPYFCWGAGIGAVLGGRHGHDARTERHDAA